MSREEKLAEFDEAMREVRDDEYERGRKTAHVRLLSYVLREMGETPGADEHIARISRWALERAQAVIALRELCGLHGDNDWTDDLHLADVIQKHLAPYLEGRS